MRESRSSSNSSRSSSSRPPQRNESSNRQGTNRQGQRAPSSRSYDGRSYDSNRGSTQRTPARRPDSRAPRRRRRRRSPLTFILPLVLIVALIFVFKSCSGGKMKLADYPLEFSSQSMTVGDSAQASLKGFPEDKLEKLVWSSGDESIVSIDKGGKMTAKKAGTVTIVAKLGDETLSKTMLVEKPAADVRSVALDYENVTIVVGETFQLAAKVMVDGDATPPETTWTTSDPSVVRVTGDGLLNAEKAGEAIVVATCGIQSATCNITVTEEGKTTAAADGTAKTDNKTDTSKTDSAKTDAEKADTAKTDSSESDAKTSDSKVTPTHVTLSQNMVQLAPKETVTLKATVSPSGADQSAVVWSSSDPSIATVSDGTITAKAKGSATITAKAGEQSTKCTVRISEK